jgi:hypothetical protein
VPGYDGAYLESQHRETLTEKLQAEGVVGSICLTSTRPGLNLSTTKKKERKKYEQQKNTSRDQARETEK